MHPTSISHKKNGNHPLKKVGTPLNVVLTITLLLLFISSIKAQTPFSNKKNTSISYRGQFSAYTHYNPGNEYQLWNGARYIPRINLGVPKGSLLIDFEISTNIHGNLGLKKLKYTSKDGYIKPYRAWARLSGNQFEVRAGLQKINFGPAKMLRPLMWFDQIDPRDPLQLTDGVWGVLGRYYFLNNTNIWLWVLHGNNSTPETGGRIQHPFLGTGEIALSYHYKTSEHRVGFDARFDWITGIWIEGSWTTTKENTGIATNQHLLNIGADYTFDTGNGLTVTCEHLLASFSKKAFQFNEYIYFSAMSASYPLSIIDQLNIISYYDWSNKSPYFFINWQKQFNNLTLNLIGYSNPEEYKIPMQNQTVNLFAGNGIQLMIVYNQ